MDISQPPPRSPPGEGLGRVLDGFGEDFGRVLEDFGKVLGGFLDYFSHFYRKSRFCKKIAFSPGKTNILQVLSSLKLFKKSNENRCKC